MISSQSVTVWANTDPIAGGRNCSRSNVGIRTEIAGTFPRLTCAYNVWHHHEASNTLLAEQRHPQGDSLRGTLGKAVVLMAKSSGYRRSVLRISCSGITRARAPVLASRAGWRRVGGRGRPQRRPQPPAEQLF